jgi:hypothetical protein
VKDPFNEPKVALETIKREFTHVGSLNAPTAFTAVVACEGAVKALYQEATRGNFPYQQHPRHKPGQWITALGIGSYYSPETRTFLNKLDGYSLDKGRYEESAAFGQYVNAPDRSQVIVEGTERFIRETEDLLSNAAAVKLLQSGP